MEVCRLCLKIILDSTYYFVDDLNDVTNREKIAIFLPEMDIDVVASPVLCMLCADFLQELHSFKQKCLHNEEKLRDYIRINKCNAAIDLLNIVNKAEPDDIKSETDADEHAVEEVVIIEEIKSNMEENEDKSPITKTNQNSIPENTESEIRNLLHCSDCEEHFETNDALLLHNLIHSGKRNCFCDICKKGFCSAKSLKEHMKHHGSNKPFRCRFCDNTFVYRATWLNHELIHTGERPFNCETCGKSFRQSAALSTHIRCVHGTEKSFTCDLCPKKFSVRNLLNLHMKRHIGSSQKVHKCDNCSKSFYTRSALTRHAMWHTNEKTHICIICRKGFIEKSLLKRHMRTHTGEKPYECNVCGFKCTQKYNLNVHVSSHYKSKK